MGLPRWIGAMLAADRMTSRVLDLQASLRNELMWALVPPSERAAVTEAIYEGEQGYHAGAPHFERGLFWWEARLLDWPSVPRGGRVLVGGAGGGRELAVLESRGYAVTGFEPCAALARAAQAVT